MAKPIQGVLKDKPIIGIPSQVNFTAAAAEGDKKGPASFEVNFYNGGELPVKAYEHPVVVDLSGLDQRPNLLADLDHDSTKRVGNFEVTNDGKSLVAHGKATARTAARDEVVGSAEDGFQWEASLDVQPKVLAFVPKGRSFQANGQTFEGPKYWCKKGTLKGFAFVSQGADPTTSVDIAAEAASHKEPVMRDDVKAWAAEIFPSLNLETLTEEQVANIEADFDGQKGKRKPIKAAATGNPFEDMKLEGLRQSEIQATATQHLERRKAARGGRVDEKEVETVWKMCDHAIEANMSPLEFKVELQDSMLPTGVAVHAARGRDSELPTPVIEAAICQQGGMSDSRLNECFSDQVQQAAHSRFKHGIGLKQLWRIFARAHGFRDDCDSVSQEMHNVAFTKPAIHASGGFSTYDLAGLLGNTANKFLLEGWGGGEMTWEKITDIVSVSDFKTATFYKLSGNLTYKKIAPGGQIEHGQVSTDSYTVANETYGRMFGIDRTAIINDDLSAITRIPLELGFAANDAFNEVFWTEFLDNASFFAAGNSNVSTGAVSAANAITALSAAEVVFNKQTKPNGTPLGRRANYWLLPPETFRFGFNALHPLGLVTGGSSTVPAKNSLGGLYEAIWSQYISNTSYSGSSTTKNYLLANRPGFSTMLTSFLNGRRSPVVESAQASFNELGMSMRAYHDFGCNKMEYRAGVQGSGA